jgi:hypothetical protein
LNACEEPLTALNSGIITWMCQNHDIVPAPNRARSA